MAAAYVTALAERGGAARIGHVPALDGLRGIAVLAVMAYHGSHRVSGGFLGVDVFFALSGFLITALLVRERTERGAISLARFYARRALRLFPALTLLLAVYLAVAALVDTARFHRHALDAGSVLLYAANLPRAFDVAMRPTYLGPCWSLSVEEHFYLLWPPILIGLARRVRSPRRLAAVVAAMALVSWALRSGLLLAGTDTDRLYYMLDTRADALLVGCALGVLHGAGALPTVPPGLARRTLAAAALLVGAAWLALLLTARFGDTANHVWRFTFMAGTTALVVFCAVAVPESLPSRVLASRPLAGLGRISYGLYLWHYPIFFALAHDVGLSLGATLALGTPLSLAAAALSYRWVERPALRLKRRFV